MRVTTDSFSVRTSLSESQVEELLQEKFAIRALNFWFRNCEGFAGQLHTDKKEFEFAYFYRRAKCAVVKGFYTADAKNVSTVHFDIRWPVAEILLFVLGVLASAIVPFIISTQIVAFPMQFLIIWALIALAFCSGLLGYFYIPSIKRARTKLLEIFAPHIESEIVD